jgi:hypothetical protein
MISALIFTTLTAISMPRKWRRDNGMRGKGFTGGNRLEKSGWSFGKSSGGRLRKARQQGDFGYPGSQGRDVRRS